MLSMLNPGPGLVEEFDCEKLKAVTPSRKASTIPNLRISKVSLGRRVRFYDGPIAESNRDPVGSVVRVVLARICSGCGQSPPQDPVIIRTHRLFEAGVPYDVRKWQWQQRLHGSSTASRVASPPQERKQQRQFLADALRATGRHHGRDVLYRAQRETDAGVSARRSCPWPHDHPRKHQSSR